MFPQMVFFPDCFTVIRGDPRLATGAPGLVPGAPRCSQACRRHSQTCRHRSQVISNLSQSLPGTPAVFLSGQARPAFHRLGWAALWGCFSMRAGLGQAGRHLTWPVGFSSRACRLSHGGQVAFLAEQSLNRLFCLKDSLLPLLRISQKYETQTISNSIIVALPLPYSIYQPDQGICTPINTIQKTCRRGG